MYFIYCWVEQNQSRIFFLIETVFAVVVFLNNFVVSNKNRYIGFDVRWSLQACVWL